MPYDYIIIGAGSAGCVLANRLTEDPDCQVLLIEAGGKDSKPQIKMPGAYATLHMTEIDWKFYTDPQENANNRKLYVPRGKTLGGSSSTNAMAYVRGSKDDYNEWAALGNLGWGYDDVLHYFKKSENNEQFGEPYHGIDGPLNITWSRHLSPLSQAFMEACEESGIPRNYDYNGSRQEGVALLQFTMKNHKRHSAASAFLKPAMRRKNLTVKIKTQVQRILVENGRAVGVEAITAKSLSAEHIFCSKEVILSAGTIQSPQILMLSGIGDPGELRRHGITAVAALPGVGKNLQDHVWVPIGCSSKIPTGNALLEPKNMAKALMQQVLFGKGPLSISPLEANAFFSTSNELTRPDVQFHFIPIGLSADYSTNLYDLKTYPKRNGFGIMAILIRPESRGYVGLRSADPADPPVIQPNILSTTGDRELLLEAMYKAMEVLTREPFSPYARNGIGFPVDHHTDEALMTHMRKSLELMCNPVGTCKMGHDLMAVVDDSLRVRGIKGLRVIDASIMPNIVSGNTNAAAIMIGEKGADLVKIGNL